MPAKETKSRGRSASAEQGFVLPPGARLLTPMILEEKPICRAAITRLVSDRSEFGPAHLAASLAEAIEKVGVVKPDLLLIDLFSIGYDFKGLEKLVSIHPESKNIVIDDRLNPAFVRLSIESGVDGYACKSFELAQFQAVISAVCKGGRGFPPEVSVRAPREAAVSADVVLSPRQLEVLKLISVGKNNQEIADALGITAGTVKLHTHAVLRITGTRNRTEAALIAGRFIVPIVEALPET